MKAFLLCIALATLLFLTACAQAGNSVETPAAAEVVEEAASAIEEEVVLSTDAPLPSPTATEIETMEEPAKAPPLPTAAVLVEPTEITIVPIEVTYFTPAQMEGPYYPDTKPEDRDNDLTVLAGTAGTPAGEIIELTGKVYDATGMPASGVVVEIWQTDSNGVYLHPNDPGTDQRDKNFQFYGEAVAAVDGSYRFRTILPGHYEPRPRHIHVKVKREGQELLTTQFYFEGDPELTSESMFSQTDDEGSRLIISLKEGQDANGNPILTGQRDIILSVTLPSG